MFHFHKWSDWGPSYGFGYRLYQNKRCLKCGIEKQREIGVPRRDRKQVEREEHAKSLDKRQEMITQAMIDASRKVV